MIEELLIILAVSLALPFVVCLSGCAYCVLISPGDFIFKRH